MGRDGNYPGGGFSAGAYSAYFPAIVLGVCILIALCWPKLTTTYLIVAAGFFLLHKFATTNTAGQQLVDKLASGPASSQLLAS